MKMAPQSARARLKPGVAYEAYRACEDRWIGQVPSHWITRKASRLFGLIGSGTTPKSDNLDYYSGDIPWVTTSELRESTIHSTAKGLSSQALNDYSTLKLYPPGTLLVAMYGATIGRLGILGVRATVNQACCALSNPDQGVSRFFYYWLLMYRPILLSLSVGGGQPNLSQEDLREIRIPTPSFGEQQAIVAFLDRQTARVDALVKKKERLIELLEEKRAAMISQAVTNGLGRKAPMKESNVEWLGSVPAHWDVAPVYARYIVQLGKMLDEKRISGQNLVPYLRNVDVQWDEINIVDLPEMDITQNEYDRYTLRPGDLLICEGGEVGRAAIWQGQVARCGFQKALHRIRPRNGGEEPRFLYYVMVHAAGCGALLASGNPNTIAHLTAENLRVLRLPFPPLPEQREIASFLDTRTAQIGAMVQKVNGAISLLREYRTAVISAAVTGKIDVRDCA